MFNKKRPLSWSAISSFEWNREQWYLKYVAGEKPEVTPELVFGSMIDRKIQDDPSFLPELPRYQIMQHKMETMLGDTPLIGYADTYEPARALRDYKTGKKAWDKKRADETGQLTMYALMLWLTEKVRPDGVEFYIDWLPTHIHNGGIALVEPVKIHSFKTARTMQQVLNFGRHIKEVVAEMEDFAMKRGALDVDTYEKW